MKKFFTLLILFLILGGAAAGFYFGWLQLRLGENDYGVVFTKMYGYDDKVLEPGRFIWRWEALIPTNLKLHVYHLEPQQRELSVSGTLPSGDLYRNFFEGNPDFSYRITLVLNFILDPEALPRLAETENLTPDNLDSYYQRQLSAALAQAVNILREKAEDPDFYTGQGIPKENLEELIAGHLGRQLPEIKLNSLLVKDVTVPDLTLYQKAREAYFAMMETQKSLSTESLRAATAKAMEKSVNLELLEKYGELLTRYPVLLDYLNANPAIAVEMLLGQLQE